MFTKYTCKNYLLNSPVVTYTMVLVSALVFFTAGTDKLFEYDHTAIGAGQVWRLVTGHLVHWSFEHFFWCALVLLGFGWVCEKFNRKGFITVLILSGLTASAAIWVWMPGMAAYRGLSGVGSGIFMLCTLWLIRDCFRNKQWLLFSAAGLAVLVFWLKITFESVNGTAIVVRSEDLFVPVPLVHFAGGICGIIGGLWFRPRGH